MNFKRKEPQIEPPSSRIDFAKLADDIEREETPRVSEFAPPPPAQNHSRLRERLAENAKITMREQAAANKAIIDEANANMERITQLYQTAKSENERFNAMVHTAAEVVNENNLKVQQTIQEFCTVLEQLKSPSPPRTNKPKYEKPSIKEVEDPRPPTS